MQIATDIQGTYKQDVVEDELLQLIGKVIDAEGTYETEDPNQRGVIGFVAGVIGYDKVVILDDITGETCTIYSFLTDDGYQHAILKDMTWKEGVRPEPSKEDLDVEKAMEDLQPLTKEQLAELFAKNTGLEVEGGDPELGLSLVLPEGEATEFTFTADTVKYTEEEETVNDKLIANGTICSNCGAIFDDMFVGDKLEYDKAPGKTRACALCAKEE